METHLESNRREVDLPLREHLAARVLHTLLLDRRDDLLREDVVKEASAGAAKYSKQSTYST